VPVVTEPLTVQVPCWTSPAESAPAVLHPVTLQPDGRLHTPHDLEAERIAAAFGGYLSCLVVADSVVPALDGWWALRARDVLPTLRRATRGTWRSAAAATAPCCAPVPSAGEAAAHLRSREHLTRRLGLPPRLVRPLADAVLEARGDPPSPSAQAASIAEGCVRDTSGLPGSGVRLLWEAGMAPPVVRSMHDRLVGPDGPPLPTALYLGALVRRTDLGWVAAALQQVADAVGGPLPAEHECELAEWLLTTGATADRGERVRRGAWLTLGVPRRWIPHLARGGYEPADARRLAAGTGRSVPGAADYLRAWLAAGTRPAVDDLLRLHRGGLPPWSVPSRAAVDRLCDQLAMRCGRGSDLTARTQAALVLAREGTVPDALDALTATIPTPPHPTVAEQECA
jgi:hypothetical protein